MNGFEKYFHREEISRMEEKLAEKTLTLPDLVFIMGEEIGSFCKNTGFIPSDKDIINLTRRSLTKILKNEPLQDVLRGYSLDAPW